MSDPFEVRIRFTSQLQRLNASINSSHKAATYAIKNKDMDEDLHSCILEQLENNNMNIRANIMYFIEHFCDVAEKEAHPDYIRMIQRDILRIVDAVTPSDGSGAANIKVVRNVIRAMHQKGHLDSDKVTEIETALTERDTAVEPNLSPSQDVANQADTPGARNNTARPPRVDKRQIEQRIEEDRERHKRLKEEMWKVPTDDLGEFQEMWDNTSEIGEDDLLLAKEEADERELAVKEHIAAFTRPDR